jgi:hypothetical protein
MASGGKREGSGRKPLESNIEASKEKEAQKIAFSKMKQRILRSQDALLNAQMGLAQGFTFLYCITTNVKGIKSKPVLVTSQDTIEAYLAGELDGEPDEYYYMTTKEPDGKAIDSLLDRTHGKARQNIGIDGGEDDKPIAIKSVEEDLRNWGNTK